MKRINLALIGCGRIMPAHLNGLMKIMEEGIDVKIRGLVARKKEDALRFRKRGEGPPPRPAVGPPGDPLVAPHVWIYDFQKDADVEIYTDYKEMLKRKDIDAVAIYAPPHEHHNMALASIAAGKHVLVEKPFAVSVKAARKMVDAAAKAKKVLGVAEVLRYGSDIRMTKWAIDQGYVGEVQMIVNAIMGCYWSPDKIVGTTPWRHKKLTGGGGPVVDFGAHIFDMARYYGGEIEEVEGITKVFENVRVTRDEAGQVIDRVDNEVDDTFIAITKFESGAIGQFTFSWALHGEPTNVNTTIYGSKGCIKNNALMLDDGTKIALKELFDREASPGMKERFFPMGIADWFALENMEFLNAIWECREMETSGKEGLRDLAVCYAVIESSRLKRAVKVDDIISGKIGKYEKQINTHYGLSKK